MKKILGLLSACAFVLLLAPSAQAATMELLDGGDTITEVPDLQGGDDTSTPMNMIGYYSDDPIGTEYSLTFSITDADSIPVFPIFLGLNPADDVPYTITSSTDENGDTSYLFTVTGTSESFGDIGLGGDFNPTSFFLIIMVYAVEPGVDGPPEDMKGGYLYTNVMDWNMIPPSEETKTFGFELTGPAGHQGELEFFIPTALIDFLGIADINDLVLAVDDEQTQSAVTETTGGVYDDEALGGALFTTSVTFTTAGGLSGIEAASSSITKTIAATQADRVSLSLAKTSLDLGDKKKKSLKLYIQLKNHKKNEKITLWKKTGKAPFTTLKKFKTVRSKADGYIAVTVQVARTTTFQARWDGVKSDKRKVTVD